MQKGRKLLKYLTAATLSSTMYSKKRHLYLLVKIFIEVTHVSWLSAPECAQSEP